MNLLNAVFNAESESCFIQSINKLKMLKFGTNKTQDSKRVNQLC